MVILLAKVGAFAHAILAPWPAPAVLAQCDAHRGGVQRIEGDCEENRKLRWRWIIRRTGWKSIVVSDGSNDETPEIVRSYADRGVISMHEAACGGKSAALNRAVAAASGEILLFSDANNDYNADAVRAIARHFFDPCGRRRAASNAFIRQRDANRPKAIASYWRMESAIKLAESQFSTITNADGEMKCLRAVRANPAVRYQRRC